MPDKNKNTKQQELDDDQMEKVAAGKFYRPNPAGDGTTEHFFTVEIGEGRLASIKRVSPDVIDPAS